MTEEWEKTVLTDKQLGKIRATIPGTTNVISFAIEVSKRTAKAQAEATWEAAYQAGEQAGIQKVADWIDKKYPIGTPKWEAKKKEWGLE